MMNVNEQQTQILNFFRASRAVRALDEQIYQVEKVDEQRVIELLQLAPAIEVLRVEPLDALSLQRPDNRVVGVEQIAEHGIFVNRRRWPRRSSAPYILVRVQVDVLDGRQRQRAHLYRFGGRHTRDTLDAGEQQRTTVQLIDDEIE